MDRIKRLSMEILDEHRDKFGTDFTENKKILDNISIVRSKGLKNELAGFITKFIKREIRDQEAKEEQVSQESNQTNESDEIDVQNNVENSQSDAKSSSEENPKENTV